MNKAHGKTLIIENNTNNTMINTIINSNNNNNGSGVNHLVNGYTSGNEDDGELMTDQQNLDETYFASKIVDRVACDICNKQVCNKYFLRTHKQKVHGIFDTSPSNVLASLSENAKYKSNPLTTSTNPNRTFNGEGEDEEIIADELRYDDEDTNDYNMMMIDENEDENDEEAKYGNRKNGANNRKSNENDDNNESASGKELGELVLNAEPGESFGGHDEATTVNKNQNIVEKKRRMSTCSDSTTSKMIVYCFPSFM